MSSASSTSASSATQQQQAPPPRALVVFDYDFSLVNDDCDLFFFMQFCPQLLQDVEARLRGANPPTWPGLVDYVLVEFAKRMPHVTDEQIIAKLAQIPILPRMLDAVKLAVDQYDATVVIVSDANDVFIQSMVDHHVLHKYITQIHTNPAYWEQTQTEPAQGEGEGEAIEKTTERLRLRLKPYHPLEEEPHGCVLCPSNMCKGRILDAIRSKDQYDVVLYVGDGIGDYCPSTRLTSHDTVFARANDPTGKSFGLLERIHKTTTHTVKAQVVEWSTGIDIYDHFQQALDAAVARPPQN